MTAARADSAEAKLAELDRRAASVARTQNSARGRLEEIARQQRSLTLQRTDAEARSSASAAAVRDWAVVAYKSGGLYLAALLDTDSATTLASRTAYLDRLAGTARRSSASAAAAARDVSEASARLDELAAVERRTIAQLDGERRRLVAAQAEQQRIIATRPPPPAPSAPTAVTPQRAATAPQSPSATAPKPSSKRAADAAPTPSGGPDAGGGSDQGTFEITCYAGEQGTSSGERVRPGVAATDWRVIPKGRSFRLEGLGTYTALDTGGAIKGRRIDIWNASEAWCERFGRQQRRLYLL